MFFILKWSFIAMVFGGLWYGISMIRNLESPERQRMKQEALKVLESGDTHELTDSVSYVVKEDVAKKKAYILDTLRHYIKRSMDD